MSGSSRRTSYSRSPRYADTIDIAVTEASFQSLALSPSPGNQYPTSLSPYQPAEPQYRRPSYGRSEPSATYLPSSYDSSGFIAAPSVAFPIVPSQGPQFGNRSPYLTPTVPSQPQIPQITPAHDMSYSYMQPSLQGSAAGHSYSSTGYYPPQAQDPNIRSMSTSFPPPLSSNFGDHRRVEVREVARQRRRNSQENRRQSKMRERRTRLPSIMDASLGSTQVPGGLVDSSLAAPLTYVTDRATPSYDPNTRGGYGVVSGNTAPYGRPDYSISTVNPSNTTRYQYANTGAYRTSPVPAPIHPEPVVLDRREKPRCYDHGCNGREFSTFSNLLRHQREKSGTAAKSHCPNCGAEFTRTTARNGHMEHGKCKPRRSSDA